ncbi:MAG: hypothetical protein Tsb0013_23530 [Phycisphaerales bacterium]
MTSRCLIPIALACVGTLASAEEPALEMVARTELASPLAVELQVPPAELGGVDDFRRLWRDPRFPTVLLRKHGAVYAAFRRTGPVPGGRSKYDIPTDLVYFLGRPTEADIARVWPDAVRSERVNVEAAERVHERSPERAAPYTRVEPRMAHMPTRTRRLEALASKYAPGDA